MNAPKITITEPVTSRVVNGKNGQRTIFSQKATLETEAMRIQVDVEVDGMNAGYPVGVVKEWDLAADLVPGRYGPELARRMTLRDPVRVQPAAKA